MLRAVDDALCVGGYHASSALVEAALASVLTPRLCVLSTLLQHRALSRSAIAGAPLPALAG